MTYTPSSKNPFFGTHPRIEQKIPKMDVLQLSKEWECAICKRRAGLCTIPQNFFLEIFPSIFASLVSQREKRKWVKRNTKESEKKFYLSKEKDSKIKLGRLWVSHSIFSSHIHPFPSFKPF